MARKTWKITDDYPWVIADREGNLYCQSEWRKCSDWRPFLKSGHLPKGAILCSSKANAEFEANQGAS